MATPQEVIDRATSLLRVRTAGVTFSTDDANKNTDAFTALQNMISEWAEDDVIGIPAPSALSDTLDIPEGTVRALVYNLAIEIADDFGKQPTPTIFNTAMKTLKRLEADASIDISVDNSDLALLSRGGRYNIEQDR